MHFSSILIPLAVAMSASAAPIVDFMGGILPQILTTTVPTLLEDFNVIETSYKNLENAVKAGDGPTWVQGVLTSTISAQIANHQATLHVEDLTGSFSAGEIDQIVDKFTNGIRPVAESALRALVNAKAKLRGFESATLSYVNITKDDFANFETSLLDVIPADSQGTVKNALDPYSAVLDTAVKTFT
ncbi:hypothetical protein C8034_v006328 [Colletotrichum sidae]|uniref:Uncharacterized protein n=1 Tax=Colletotrichum sidae TaxID=1347389 RepID=A0A4R8TTS6_9PEZI|nr:hypothetical protein C8034_v006328 [Colletotrichum sidae]